jgi:CRISPR/Cas system-associated exonuclease Cas4 (RecB family)
MNALTERFIVGYAAAIEAEYGIQCDGAVICLTEYNGNVDVSGVYVNLADAVADLKACGADKSQIEVLV